MDYVCLDTEAENKPIKTALIPIKNIIFSPS